MYHVPALIRHPSTLPLVTAFRYPEPENVPGAGVPVGDEVVVVVVTVLPPDLGRYLTPDVAQLDVEPPSGLTGTKVPV